MKKIIFCFLIFVSISQTAFRTIIVSTSPYKTKTFIDELSTDQTILYISTNVEVSDTIKAKNFVIDKATISYSILPYEIRISTNIFVDGNIFSKTGNFYSFGLARIYGTAGAVLGDEVGGWYIKVPNTAGITINPASGFNTLVNSRLDVMGDIGIMKTGDAFIGTTGNYNLSLRTNDADRITITSDGKVGINKTPATALDVNGQITLKKEIEQGGYFINSRLVYIGGDDSITSPWGRWWIGYGIKRAQSGSVYGWITTHPYNSLLWNKNERITYYRINAAYGTFISDADIENSIKWFLTPTGGAYFGNNVGIGTTSPSQRLTVAGNIALQAGTNAFVGTADNYNLSLRTNNTDRITITNTGEMLISNLSDYSGIVGRIGGSGHPSGSALGIGTTSQHSLVFITSNTLQMIISPEGRVGIGRHYSHGLPYYSSDVWLQILDPSNAWMRMQSSVGISQSAGIYLRTANGSALIGAYENPGGIYMRLGTTSAHRLEFLTDDSIRMTILSNGNVGINTTSPSYTLHVNGSFAANSKNFDIPHPLDPENKRLVHATLEGPEYGVYYRGEARLQNGKAIIELPEYFEALTREEDRTILLTNIDGFDKLCVKTQDGKVIKDGKFIVISDNPNSNQRFFWEVKAVRKDVDKLVVEKTIEKQRTENTTTE